jgi:hypothetical protein
MGLRQRNRLRQRLQSCASDEQSGGQPVANPHSHANCERLRNSVRKSDRIPIAKSVCDSVAEPHGESIAEPNDEFERDSVAKSHPIHNRERVAHTQSDYERIGYAKSFADSERIAQRDRDTYAKSVSIANGERNAIADDHPLPYSKPYALTNRKPVANTQFFSYG